MLDANNLVSLTAVASSVGIASPASANPVTSPLWSLPKTVLIPLLGLPAFWVISFLIYCVKCAIFGMDRTPRIDQVVKTPWLPRIFMEFGYWMFRIPVRLCIVLGITPNMITFGSMLLTVLAAGVQVIGVVGEMLVAAGVVPEQELPQFAAAVAKMAVDQHNAAQGGQGAR